MMKLLTADKEAFNKEHRQRLKERFKSGSVDAFQNHEILELLLTYAAPKKDVKHLSRVLIQRFKGLRGVLDATPEELKAAAGLSDHSSVMLKLVKDVAGVYLKERIMGKDVIRCAKDVIDYLNLTLSGERVEKFLAMYLNSRNELLAVETLHEGTINQTAVYPRKAIEKAFKYNAHGVIFVHNHPSGDATPSDIDRQLTKILDRAALAIDLMVHDHMIVGRNKHFSARENGWIIGCQIYSRQATS